MSLETRQCQNCKKDFTIEPDDLPKDFDINKEIFVYLKCKKNYRIIQNEFSFY